MLHLPAGFFIKYKCGCWVSTPASSNPVGAQFYVYKVYNIFFMSMRAKRSISGASSTSTSGFVPPKRKHVKLPIEQKLSVIERMEKGESVTRLAAEYGIGTRTVYDLRRHKAELLKIFAFQEAQKGAERSESKTSQSSVLPLVDKATYEWFKKCREINKNVSGPMIMAKAKFFHEQMKVPDYCDYNVRWLTGFKNRHSIGALELSGECASSGTGTADTYVTNFTKVDTTNHNSSEMDYVQCIGEYNFICYLSVFIFFFFMQWNLSNLPPSAVADSGNSQFPEPKLITKSSYTWKTL